jgi:hypothetical protein
MSVAATSGPASAVGRLPASMLDPVDPPGSGPTVKAPPAQPVSVNTTDSAMAVPAAARRRSNQVLDEQERVRHTG